jgi:hypothetical protein
LFYTTIAGIFAAAADTSKTSVCSFLSFSLKRAIAGYRNWQQEQITCSIYENRFRFFCQIGFIGL